MNPRLIAVLAIAAAPFAAQAAFAQTAAAPAATTAPKPLTRAMFSADMDTEFTTVDANKDGKLTKAEIEGWQTREGATVAAARNKSVFVKLDTDKNGQLSAAEFARLGPPAPAANAQPILARLDVNKDGSITKEEHHSRTMVKFDALDANKDGQVTQAEAAAAAKAGGAQR